MVKTENGTFVVGITDIREDVHSITQKLGSVLSDFKANFGMFTTEMLGLREDLQDNNVLSKDTAKSLNKLEHDLAHRNQYIDKDKLASIHDTDVPLADYANPYLVQDMHQDYLDDNAVYNNGYFKKLQKDTINFVNTYLAVDATKNKIDTETQDFINEHEY